MELRVENLGYSYKGKKILKDVSFVIDSNSVVGLTGMYKSLLLEILDLTKDYQGKLFWDGVEVEEANMRIYQKKIALISQEDLFFMKTVEEEMLFVVDHYDYVSKDLKKRMGDALKLVGLSSTFLKREIATLSKSEKILVKLACSLLVNPEVILFDEVFSCLSHNHKKNVLSLIKRMKERKDKLIVIASLDVDFLYSFTDEVLILENGSLLCQEKTSKLFRDFAFLEEHQLDIPYLVEFTHLAKKKQVKLSYHRDILDLIKDVYKHV